LYLEKIHFSTFLFRLVELFQQGDQLEQGVGIESSRWQTQRGIRAWISPVRPFTRDTEATALALPQTERVDTGNSSLL